MELELLDELELELLDEFELEFDDFHHPPRRSLRSSSLEEFELELEELLELELLDALDERFELRLLDELDELLELVLPANCTLASPSVAVAGPCAMSRPVVVRGASASLTEIEAHAAPLIATTAPVALAASHIIFFIDLSFNKPRSACSRKARPARERRLNVRTQRREMRVTARTLTRS